MKANELMIGDWVRVTDKACETYCYGEYKAGEIVQVREILDYGINPDWSGAEVNDVLHLEAIEPIPLTKEILERNDFLNVGEQVIQYENGLCWVWVEEDTMRLGIDANNNSWDGECTTPMMRVHITYVHQLQHALRLCGIEKEIKL